MKLKMALLASFRPLLYLVVSVWGRTIEPAPDEEVDPEKECQVCRGRQVSIYFVPCKHEMCGDCVARSRREAIQKVTFNLLNSKTEFIEARLLCCGTPSASLSYSLHQHFGGLVLDKPSC